MNTRSLLLLMLLLFGFTTQALAQITITESDIRAHLSKNVTTTVYQATAFGGLQYLADQEGGNLTFDFRTIIYAAGESFSSEMISCTNDLPGCTDPDFTSANLIYRETYADSTGISFGRLDSDGFYVLGGASRGDYDESTPGEEDLVIKFTPAALFQKLPTSVGLTWSNTYDLTFNLLFDGLKFTTTEEHTVDGWGRLITNQGEADALRVSGWTTTAVDFGGNVILGDTTYTVDFLTKVGLTANLELDEMGTVIDASYSVPGDLNTSTDDVDNIPSRIAVGQNFPNPFSRSTTIPITMQQAAPVNLAIYDLLGREVAQLVDEMRPAGTYDVTWEAGDLPNGVYLCKLSVGGESVTRMLTLLK